MSSCNRTVFFVGVLLAFLASSVSSADNQTSPSNTTASTTPASKGVVLSVKGSGVTLTVGKNATSPTDTKAKGSQSSDEDCPEEEPIAEPEGKTNSTENRQGKELKLDEKDKYTHENATAEPEAAPDKLTGTNTTTTAAPATGTGSLTSAAHLSTGAALGVALVYLKACLVL